MNINIHFTRLVEQYISPQSNHGANTEQVNTFRQQTTDRVMGGDRIKVEN